MVDFIARLQAKRAYRAHFVKLKHSQQHPSLLSDMRYDKHSADTLGYQHAKNMQSVNNFSISLFAGTIQPMHTGKGIS